MSDEPRPAMPLTPENNTMAIVAALRSAMEDVALAMEWMRDPISDAYWPQVARAFQDLHRKLNQLELRLEGKA